MSRTGQLTTGTRTPGVERSIGERPSNRCGELVNGIWWIYPPGANGALGRDADGCASCCRRFCLRHSLPPASLATRLLLEDAIRCFVASLCTSLLSLTR